MLHPVPLLHSHDHPGGIDSPHLTKEEIQSWRSAVAQLSEAPETYLNPKLALKPSAATAGRKERIKPSTEKRLRERVPGPARAVGEAFGPWHLNSSAWVHLQPEESAFLRWVLPQAEHSSFFNFKL